MVPLPNRSKLLPVTLISKRVLQGIFTTWTALTLAFFILRFAGGDPIASLLSQGLTTPERAELLRQNLGLNKPILVQYLDYLTSLLKGDFGTSLYSGRPVESILANQIPATLELAGFSFLIAILLGFTLGIVAAWRTNKTTGRIAELLSSLALSLPVASTGILALVILGMARSDSVLQRTVAIQRLWLPAVVLGFASAGPIARVIQSGMTDTLNSPYLLAARARGIDRFQRILWHALKPSMPPAISLIALEAAFLFSGTVITESVFSRPGLGRLLVRSILQGDFPVAQIIIALAAVFYTASQVFADSLAVLLDPRLRKSQ
jgi:peptide/nickel transport system permease protein